MSYFQDIGGFSCTITLRGRRPKEFHSCRVALKDRESICRTPLGFGLGNIVIEKPLNLEKNTSVIPVLLIKLWFNSTTPDNIIVFLIYNILYVEKVLTLAIIRLFKIIFTKLNIHLEELRRNNRASVV